MISIEIYPLPEGDALVYVDSLGRFIALTNQHGRVEANVIVVPDS